MFLAVMLVVSAVTVGFVVRAAVESSTGRPRSAPVATRRLTVADLLLAASTATGIHLRYSGVTTGPLNSTHSNDIPISSCFFSTRRSISNAGSGTRTVGNPNVGEINLQHPTDAFSLPLLKVQLSPPAKGGATANLYFTNLNGTGGTPLDYLEIDLGNTLVSTFTMGSGGGQPSETVYLNFVTMTFKYRPSSSAPYQIVNYDLSTNTVS
jgi:type VI protein secretion system component Hcp